MPSAAGTPNGSSRREELLAVATRLFAARGYHGTRMDDVADVVGLNKATVYHYYASKSLILYDIYRRAADATVAALHADPSWTAREAIYHFTRREPSLTCLQAVRRYSAPRSPNDPEKTGGKRENAC